MVAAAFSVFVLVGGIVLITVIDSFGDSSLSRGCASFCLFVASLSNSMGFDYRLVVQYLALRLPWPGFVPRG